jgi:hypothetical protein
MRKYILLFISLLSTPLFAQLEVKEGSFKEVPGFVNINPDDNYQTDLNNLPFAVVKVKTENITNKQRRNLQFDGNGGTFIVLEYKTGEVWVYLTAKYASYLKIAHPDFGVVEYSFPSDLQPNNGYELTLVNKNNELNNPAKETYNFLIITTDQPNAVIYIDNERVGNKEVYKSYRAGERHSWRIECKSYNSESGVATIPEKEGEIVLINKQLHLADRKITTPTVETRPAKATYINRNVSRPVYVKRPATTTRPTTTIRPTYVRRPMNTSRLSNGGRR